MCHFTANLLKIRPISRKILKQDLKYLRRFQGLLLHIKCHTTSHTATTALTLAAAVLARSERRDCMVSSAPSSPGWVPSMLLRRATDAAVVNRRRLWSADCMSACSSACLWASDTRHGPRRLLTAGDVDGERLANSDTGSDCRHRACIVSAVHNNNWSQNYDKWLQCRGGI